MTKRREGSVLVVVALVLVALVTLFSLVVDAGALYARRQGLLRAAESAALTAAAELCAEDGDGAARAVARAHVGSGEAETSEVLRGFYDEWDEYPDFSEYREWAGEGTADFPADAAPNAVLVRMAQRVDTLLPGAGDGRAPLGVAAVGYLRRFDLASLGADGEVRVALRDRGRFGPLRLHSNGDVKLDAGVTLEGGGVRSVGQVFDTRVRPGGVFSGPAVPFSDPRPTGRGDARSGVGGIDVRPVDDRTLARYRLRASAVYAAGSPVDGIYYGTAPTHTGDEAAQGYFFDLSDVSALGERPVVFFEADAGPGPTRRFAVLRHRSLGALLHEPNDGVGRSDGVTFVSRAPVLLLSDASLPDESVGGPLDRQVVVVTADDAVLATRTIDLDGLVVRAGGDVRLFESGATPKALRTQFLRLIADGDVELDDNEGVYESRFGPPCPPVVPRLGRLERTP